MKSNIKKVYSKMPKVELAEVELATQKIELGASDMYKTASKANSVLGKLSSNNNKIEGIIKQLSSDIKDAYKWYNSLASDMKDFEVKAKELGIKANTTDSYKYSKKQFDDAQYEINAAERTVDALKKSL